MHDSWFFIGVFVFIFLVWIITGGPLHPISFTGPILPQPQELGGGTYLQLPRANFGLNNNYTVYLPGSSSGPGATSYSYGQTIAATPGVRYSPPSDYGNIVYLNHSVSNASSTDPKTEYIEISVAQNAAAAVKITGWSLLSGATSRSEVIPKGTTLPVSGVVNANEDIILQPGDRAYIISGESPVGASFRENKCIGYFGSFQKFTPSLPLSCPSASDELSTYYGTPYIHDPACIDYTNSLSRCQAAVSRTTKLTSTCEDFVTSHFNYNGCLQYHRGDSDFAGNTWRIYLGRKTSMWRSRYEVVELLDDRGKTVASFTY